MARDIEHIFERLRSGTVPQRSLDTFAVGIDIPREEIQRQLQNAENKEGAFKFLRGGYGCGKTFMARLALQDAHARNFAGTEVMLSIGDLHLHKLDDVYRKLMENLSTPYCERQAFSDILDRWIGKIEESLIDVGVDEDAPDFDERVAKRLEEDLIAKTANRVPAEMARAVSTIFKLKQQRRNLEAAGLISWLSGSKQTDNSIRKLAGLKGDINKSNALSYLRGVLEIVKAAGYSGLVIIVDELDTMRHLQRLQRANTLGTIHHIVDQIDHFPGLLWIFAAPPEFYDSTRGVAGLEPLHNRLRLKSSGGLVPTKQPQLELKPFDAPRLIAVAQKLKELYPTTDRGRLERKVTKEVIQSLVAKATQKFGGDVGVVPRQFLTDFIMMLDLVEEHPDYDPASAEGLVLAPTTPEELSLVNGGSEFQEEPGDSQPYELVEF